MLIANCQQQILVRAYSLGQLQTWKDLKHGKGAKDSQQVTKIQQQQQLISPCEAGNFIQIYRNIIN